MYFIQKAGGLLHEIDSRTIKAIVEARHITGSILAWLKSDRSEPFEALITRLIPAGEEWTNDVYGIVSAFANDLNAISNPSALLGIALRLGAEIAAIIDGRQAGGVPVYLHAFQTVVMG